MCSAPVTFGGGWMTTKRSAPGGRLIGRAEGIGCQPALVDRRLDGRGVVARWRARVPASSSVCLLIGQTRNPFVEGRTGRGTTFVRGHGAAASCAALSGGPASARVRPSPSRSATGFQPMARLSGAAGGGVLLTVSAERRCLPPRGLAAIAGRTGSQRARSSVTRRPPSGRSSILAASPSSFMIAAATSKPSAWIARKTNSPVGPRLRLTPSMPSTRRAPGGSR